jgi:hypothetical protein
MNIRNLSYSPDDCSGMFVLLQSYMKQWQMVHNFNFIVFNILSEVVVIFSTTACLKQ